jgi:hypothetical protein
VAPAAEIASSSFPVPPQFGKQRDVVLTPAGRAFARDVVAVIAELNDEVASRTAPADLVAVDTVLRAILFDESARQRAARLPGPGVII